MNRLRLACVAAVAALLASCGGEPNASGVYVAKTSREVVLIQVIEDKTGAVTGRLETTTVGAGGVVTSQEANIDGKASGHELIFKPTSAWFGGVNASGTFTSTAMSLTRQGDVLTVNRSSLDDYQKAVAALRTTGGSEAKRVAEVRAQQQAVAAQQAAAADTADKAARLKAAINELKTGLDRVTNGVERSPDYGARAAEITAKMERMLQPVPSLGGVQRSQIIVGANQGIVATNQIEIQREQALNDAKALSQRISQTGATVQQVCAPHLPELADDCASAGATMGDIGTGLKRAADMFKAQKDAVATELARQNALIDRANRY